MALPFHRLSRTKAKDRITGADVAIKKMKMDSNEGISPVILRETAILRDLNHAHIVKYEIVNVSFLLDLPTRSLLSVIIEKDSVSLVFEYMPMDLKRFQDENKKGLTGAQIKVWSWGQKSTAVELHVPAAPRTAILALQAGLSQRYQTPGMHFNIFDIRCRISSWRTMYWRLQTLVCLAPSPFPFNPTQKKYWILFPLFPSKFLFSFCRWLHSGIVLQSSS